MVVGLEYTRRSAASADAEVEERPKNEAACTRGNIYALPPPLRSASAPPDPATDPNINLKSSMKHGRAIAEAKTRLCTNRDSSCFLDCWNVCLSHQRVESIHILPINPAKIYNEGTVRLPSALERNNCAMDATKFIS